MEYAKLMGSLLIMAPEKIKKDGMVIMNPGPDLLTPLGYKPLSYTERPDISTPGNELREVYTDNGDRITISYEEFTPEPVPEPSYGDLVVALIRERYDQNAENALNRQRDRKPEEFKAFDDYCEECKAKIKQKLGMV